MKILKLNSTKRAVLAATAVLTVGLFSLLPWRLTAQPSSNAPPPGAVANLVPLKLGSTIPLAIGSAGVEWKGNTYHLVGLGSIRFNLDKNDRLTAEIQGRVTGFDNVDYDISGVVFDAAGQMSGERTGAVQSAAAVGRKCFFHGANHHAGLWGIVGLRARGRLCGQHQQPESIDPGRMAEVRKPWLACRKL